jgi:hypothetical protein
MVARRVRDNGNRQVDAAALTGAAGFLEARRSRGILW